MLELTVLLLTAVINLVLGLVVYLKNPRVLTNRLFILLAFSLVLWSIVNYISVYPIALNQLAWIRLVIFCGALLNLSVFLTFLAYPAQTMKPHYRKLAKIAVVATCFVMPLTLSPLVFSKLSVVNGSASPVPGPGIPIFMLHTLALVGGSVYIIIKKYKSSRGIIRNQLRLVLFGITGTFFLIVLANFLFVVVLNITALVPFGPAFTIIFSSSLAYGIIRHRLFDIRAAVARTLAYVLSLGTIIATYGVVIFGFSETFIQGSATTPVQRFFYISCAVVSAIFFQPVKKFFDRVTNRIFFQDAYDPQQFFDQLNRVLVTNIQLDSLLAKSSDVLNDNLKSEFATFNIRRTAYTERRSIGTRKIAFTEDESNLLREAVADDAHPLLVTDDLLGISHRREVHSFLSEKNISLVVKLVATLKYDNRGVGYLILGPKKSGNPYSAQDVRIITIIANELVLAIENALRFEEIEQFNVTLQQKVDNATKELQKSNAKLTALDEAKDEFISMASHQLRTPLTSVKGYLSMVLEGDAGKVTPDQQKFLTQAFESSQRMVYLIADLLNVSRLKTGKFIIEKSPCNLADVVEGEISQLKETAASKNLKLTYDKPKNFPTLMLDETKIRQVVMNFTDNAIYYTPAGGSIRVGLKDTGSTIEFTVVDNGLGVPKAEQHHLFNKFYRAGNARKARPDGTGLGLFMAKKVVVAQAGAIIFKSIEGKGSTFGFSFSKSKLAVPDNLTKTA